MLNFKMNIPGVYINNSNWKHILNATHIAVMSIFTLFPLFYIVISWISSTLWEKGQLIITLSSVFIMFLPIYVVGEKFE